ncbi:lasso peptide biosynthesis B2 protein [Goodfellowiella coeruleoviolacea]|uniref:Transglutaminase-like superfamily protein n=1 Tax=Goodfellowiella coeruleoviolacea TaxID=334858 RepID=A0AAE3KJB1_9PSEU|nr:lasso peptide biosynthesis B2 protein [Goodfellowiella coeruleoviolacea]MCP2170076.1 Transglutaminase-like superfamily protein [Goodfellowiella coeruleoviolacea]
MSGRVTNEVGPAAVWYLRPVAWCVVGVARLLARLPARRLRRAMELARRGARPATVREAVRARDTVVASSVRCSGQWCLQRSIATALLCRLRGSWPTWRTGVRTRPFEAHAWVEVDGIPVGEDPDNIRWYRVVMTV